MDRPLRQTGLAFTLAGLAFLAIGSSACANGHAEPVQGAATALEPAVWQEHQLQFDYQGFTTRYSCDGLRDKVRSVLLKLGARPDLSVESFGCGGRLGQPDRFPMLRIRMATLQPAPAVSNTGGNAGGNAAGNANSAGVVVSTSSSPAVTTGSWRSVSLSGPGKLDAGDCELIEQLVAEVLPLFAVRNLEPIRSCTPHQMPVTVSLHLEAFAPPPSQ
jgi:hypothetical protein